jgi:hypothetical protein
MKANVRKYKSPMQVGELAEPADDDRAVLLDVHAADVNMLDAKLRDRQFKPFRGPPFVATRACRCVSCGSWDARKAGHHAPALARVRAQT